MGADALADIFVDDGVTADLQGAADFAVITIKEEEFAAVLDQLPPVPNRTFSRSRGYVFRQVPQRDGGVATVAVTRCLTQGNGVSQEVFHDIARELDPQWVLCVGIAGGAPASEFSLGDVLLGSSVIDMSVEAIKSGTEPTYAAEAHAADPAVENYCSVVKGHSAELGDWATLWDAPFHADRRRVEAPRIALSRNNFYGDPEWIKRTRKSLSADAKTRPRHPHVSAGLIAASDRLLKDDKSLAAWMKVARHIRAVEMESSGVYRAARGRGDHRKGYPAMTIRGISDIVGFERDDAWTRYACISAAAFTHAFVRSGYVQPRRRGRVAAKATTTTTTATTTTTTEPEPSAEPLGGRSTPARDEDEPADTGTADANRRDRRRHHAITTGLPPHRRVRTTAPEPLTTRRPNAVALAAELVSSVPPARVAVFQAPPGWGKSMFLSMVLDQCTTSVHWVNLSDCLTSHDIAEALLDGLDVDDHERVQVDQRPARAVRLLSERLSEHAIIVFENAHRNASGRMPLGFADFVHRCHEGGHVVIIESWTSAVDLPSSLPQAQLRRVDSRELLALSRDEILDWGGRVVGRQLTACEYDYLDYYSGHPLIIRGALEVLAERFPNPDDAAASKDLLEIAFDWEWTQEQFERVAAMTSVAPPVANESLLPPAIWAWFGVLPWSQLPHGGATAGWHPTLRRLRSVGLVEPVGERWHAQPWARLLGLRHVLRSAEIVIESASILLELAASVPHEHHAAQRRHLVRLAASLPAAGAALLGLLARIDDDPAAELVTAEGYQAPAAPEVIVGITALVTAAAETSAPAAEPLLPLDLQLWLLDGSARVGDATGYRDGWRLALSRGEDLFQLLSVDWRAIKLVHTALLACPVSPDERLADYVAILDRISPFAGDTLAGRAQRAWLSRLYIAGGGAALAVGRADLARGWSSTAAVIIETVPPPADDVFASSLNHDTRYRRRQLDVTLAVKLADAAAAHRHALEAVPRVEQQMPLERSRWATRTLDHVGPVLRAYGSSPELRKKIDEAFHHIGDGLRLLKAARHFLFSREPIDPEITRQVKHIVTSRATRFDTSSVTGEMLAAIAATILDPRKAVHRLPEYARRAVDAISGDAEPEAIYLLRRCLRGASRDSAVERELFDVCEALLTRLLAGEVAADQHDVDALRRIGLNYFARHMLAISGMDEGAEAGDSEGSNTGDAGAHASNTTRLAKAERRVDAAYRAHLSAGGNPWLWDDLANWKVHAMRRRLQLERHHHQQVRNPVIYESGLHALVDECTRAVGEHIARRAVALRVARYVWDVPAIRDQVEALVVARLEPGLRHSMLRLMVASTQVFALVPAELQLSDQVSLPRDRVMLGRLLHEWLATAREERTLTMGGWMVEILASETEPDHWSSLAARARRTLGQPGEYWRRILAALETGGREGLHDRRDLDDLTDPQLLTLAARLFQYGSGMTCLAPALRFELAEMAVVASYDADRWSRSIRGRRSFLASWHVGCAIGLALTHSPDRTLFGTTISHEVDRRGAPLEWRQVMDRELNAAQSMSAGKFRELVTQTRSRLKILLMRPPSGTRSA